MLASGQTQCASSTALVVGGNTLSHEEARLKSLQRRLFRMLGAWGPHSPGAGLSCLISTSVWVGAKETDEPDKWLDWPLWKEGAMLIINRKSLNPIQLVERLSY